MTAPGQDALVLEVRRAGNERCRKTRAIAVDALLRVFGPSIATAIVIYSLDRVTVEIRRF
jgi:hypothetical protein